MNLIDQVCTLEQAKKLSELGVRQETFWYWEQLKPSEIEGLATERLSAFYNFHPISNGVVEDRFPAFTCAELGVMLWSYCLNGYSFFSRFKKAWAHTGHIKNNLRPIEWHDTEASARAAMLIYLLENGHLTCEQVNNRFFCEESPVQECDAIKVE